MMRLCGLVILIVLMALNPARSFAQAAPPAQAAATPTSREEIDTKGAITVILLAGLGGAVLGLSTLSFYSNPQRHLSNISIGAALAVVGAAIYVTYRAAVGRNVKVDFENAEDLNSNKQSLLMPDSSFGSPQLAYSTQGAETLKIPSSAISVNLISFNF